MGWSVIPGEDIEFQSGGAAVRGYVGRPAAPGRFPGLIVLPGVYGPNADARRGVERLGEAGYVALLVDWQTNEQDPPDAVHLQYVADARAFLQGLDYVDGDRIAIVGFCRGGILAFLALAAHPWLRAGVLFHPSIYKELTDRRPQNAGDVAVAIDVPIYIAHGAQDRSTPIATVYRLVQQLDELGKTYFLRVYSGTGHAFTMPYSADYNPAAAADSWAGAVEFLDRVLR